MSPYVFKKLHQKVTKQKILLLVKRLVILSVLSFILFLLLNLIFPLHDRISYSTIVTDADGELVHAFLSDDDKWRMKTELEEISPLLRKTILAKEDKYFYYHPGVNVFAAGRALFNNLLSMKRTSGASTITMQVVRLLEPRPRNLVSKTVEVFRALQMEWKYSKEEIFQMYLNLVPYGGNIEGVKSASLLYFKKNPDHLSLAEITALSIIPNRPSSLVMGKNNDRITVERNRWLNRFAKEGYFSNEEINDALAEPLEARRMAVPRLIPHLAQKLRSTAGGHHIKTNIRMNTQLKLEKITEDYIRALRLKNIHNAAVVVIDNRTQNVIAYLGSAQFGDTSDGGQVNGAAAIRQPGSTLKPLLYGLCIDEGQLSPKTMITDVAVSYQGYAPENYDQKFNGLVTMEYALDHSLNIPAVRAFNQLGKETLVETLVNCGFRQVEKDRNKLGLSMILGGCGASLEQLTGLFSSFAHEGLYSKPHFIQQDTGTKKHRILSPASSFMITEILSKVNRPDFPLNWTATERMPKIAWKTGTSYGRRDAWSIGYNRHFTIGVWVGNFSGTGVAELSGAQTATPLLFKIFNTIDYDSNTEWFSPPPDCELRQVCAETGLPPGPLCTQLVSDYFIPLISTTSYCQHIQEVKISADGSSSYCASCAPAAGFRKKHYRVVKAEMENYYVENGIAYERIPPHHADCEKIFRGNGPAITAPAGGHEYFLDPKDPEPILLTARAGNDVSMLYWYVNDQFLKSAKPGEKQFFIPREGPVKISCTDDKGRNRDLWIRVKYVSL
jgi:penicillin-binding protein 1C